MCLVNIIHGVNIRSISNRQEGFTEFSVSDYFKFIKLDEFVPVAGDAVWVDYHLHNNPFTAINLSNHFGELLLIGACAQGLFKLFIGIGSTNRGETELTSLSSA